MSTAYFFLSHPVCPQKRSESKLWCYSNNTVSASPTHIHTHTNLVIMCSSLAKLKTQFFASSRPEFNLFIIKVGMDLLPIPVVNPKASTPNTKYSYLPTYLLTYLLSQSRRSFCRLDYCNSLMVWQFDSESAVCTERRCSAYHRSETTITHHASATPVARTSSPSTSAVQTGLYHIQVTIWSGPSVLGG